MRAFKVISEEKQRNTDLTPLMILSTDGSGNVSMSDDMSPQEEAYAIAKLIHQAGVPSIVINMEHASFDRELAQNLADILAGPCYQLHKLTDGWLT